MTVRATTSFLRYALLADGLISGLTGLLLLIGAPLAAPLFGLSTAFLMGTGAFITSYGAALIWLSRAPSLSPAVARAVIAGNVLWVVASVGLVLLGPASLTPLGIGFIVVQAAAVGVLAELQWMGLRRQSPAVVAA